MKTVLSKFRRIGIIADKPNHETAMMIFLLQHLTHPVFGGKKSQINVFKPKELESSDFQKKFENKELITIRMPQNKTGRNFNTISEVLSKIGMEGKAAAIIIMSDSEKLSPTTAWDHTFGQTIGDALSAWRDKDEKDIVSYQKKFTDLLFPHLEKICDAVEEFRKNSISTERGILSVDHALEFSTILSELRNKHIRAVAHLTKKVDILFHRRDTEGGNFISTSERAKKHLPAIFGSLLKEELRRNPSSNSLWHMENDVIFTDLGKRSVIKFTEIVGIIEKTVSGIPAFKTNNGAHMPVEARHSDSLQTDSALSKAPIIALHEREHAFESSSQVA